MSVSFVGIEYSIELNKKVSSAKVYIWIKDLRLEDHSCRLEEAMAQEWNPEVRR